MSGSQFEDGPEVRASALQGAADKLAREAEHLRTALCLSSSTADIVRGIKQAMEAQASSQNLTVLQILCDREWDKTFNARTAELMPDVRREFRNALADHLSSDESPASVRKARKVAENAWKRDVAAQRREIAGSDAPHRGRPEIYDPDVLLAFADAIARVAGRPRFSTGHHGDIALRGDGSPMLRVLVAAVQWAMTAAWLSAASPGTPPPIVKTEGILTALKRSGGLTD